MLGVACSSLLSPLLISCCFSSFYCCFFALICFSGHLLCSVYTCHSLLFYPSLLSVFLFSIDFSLPFFLGSPLLPPMPSTFNSFPLATFPLLLSYWSPLNYSYYVSCFLLSSLLSPFPLPSCHLPLASSRCVSFLFFLLSQVFFSYIPSLFPPNHFSSSLPIKHCSRKCPTCFPTARS